ncbi:MAG: methyltransferase domain-containing protein [Marmoricola sp.]
MADYQLAMSDAELLRYRMMAQRAVAIEKDDLELAGVRPGATVVDMGCGPAAMSVELARLVGPSGRVIAVEPGDDSRAAAADVISASGLPNIELRAGTILENDLASGSADVVMLRHVLAHNGGHEQEYVSHLATLLRPGGCLYLLDVDITAIRTIDSDPDLDDLTARYAAFHRSLGNDPQVGLRLAQFLEGAGLEVRKFSGTYNIVTVSPGMRSPSWAAREAMVAAGTVTRAEVEAWAAALERTDRSSTRPVTFLPFFVAIGQRG